MLLSLQEQFNRADRERFREAILAVKGDGQKLLDRLASMDKIADTDKPDKGEQYRKGVNELAGLLGDQKTKRQGLRQKQEELGRAEKVLKHLKGRKNGG